jgi:hypothetical protein
MKKDNNITYIQDICVAEWMDSLKERHKIRQERTTKIMIRTNSRNYTPDSHGSPQHTNEWDD